MIDLILNDSVKNGTLRETVFKEIGKEILMTQKEAVEMWPTVSTAMFSTWSSSVSVISVNFPRLY